MTDDTSIRRVELSRLALGRYRATNADGVTLELGSADDLFSPVELLLTAIAGCSAADVDFITAKRAEPLRFDVHVTGNKVRDASGNHLTNLRVGFDIAFPDDEAGDAARETLPRAVEQSHDRLCTVVRTIELGTPVDLRLRGGPAGSQGDLADVVGETERMLLRPYRSGDLAAFADLHSRDEVTRYLPWHSRDDAAARAALDRHQHLRLDKNGDGITFAGIDKETERLVGEFVLILRSAEHRGGELGYVVHPDFQGRGLATEGARAMLRLGFEVLGWRRIIARIDSRNTASAAVLERLGMRHEAHLVQNELFKGEWSDEDDYAMLAAEWADKRSAPEATWRRSTPATDEDTQPAR
jgi:RimJ/RimL family protein N-acetyltransferase/uncharacterized OsmC-like protein